MTLNYILTGEDATLNGVVPKEEVDFKNGGWGAWEMAIRYDGLAIGDNMFRPTTQGGIGAASDSNASGVNGFSWGLNWYLNRIMRLGVTVEYNTFTGGGAPDSISENSELGFLTRLQLKY